MKKLVTRAFTLVEIMIIVVIAIVLLLAIALPTFRHASETSRKTRCIGGLGLISAAKEQWVKDHKNGGGTVVLLADLSPLYIRDFPSCPSGGEITIGKIGEAPTCSIPGHALP
ncbi:MAG: hypothetical protein HZB70_01235 [Candidatus Berkelbacteria bacterium]|nr:MAG: hypothetical protein HZB70_01235 [Candidatus Berkelbacteria bacterium]QQG52037.1 MAG: hypothetical protein HY845_01760 [Candidatus Berkelbacteria bacterium]